MIFVSVGLLYGCRQRTTTVKFGSRASNEERKMSVDKFTVTLLFGAHEVYAVVDVVVVDTIASEFRLCAKVYLDGISESQLELNVECVNERTHVHDRTV